MASNSHTGSLAALSSAILLLVSLISSLFYNQLQPLFMAMAGLAMLGAVTVAIWTGRPPESWRHYTPLWLVFGLWLWWLILSTTSPVAYVSQGSVCTLAVLPASATTAVWLRDSRAFNDCINIGIGLLVAALALTACFQFFILAEKPGATFINRNNFAAFQILIALSATGIALQHRHHPLWWIGLTLMALLIFVIGLIGSRGALITASAGMAMLLYLARRNGVATASLWRSAAVFIMALGAAQLASMGELGSRVSSLADPWAAGNARFLIWEGSWEMVQQAPWYGLGPGLYWLLWPPHRHIDDTSAGFYAHNDYMQFLIESGWPGLILILLSMATLAWRVLPGVLARVSVPRGVEAAGLFSGLAAVAAHSLLTFNLYLMPILLVMGVALGRLLSLTPAPETSTDTPDPRSRSPLAMRLALSLALLTPLGFYLSALGGSWHFREAQQSLSQGEHTHAQAQLDKASQWWPEVDLYHYLTAWLKLQSLSADNTASTSEPEDIINHLDEAAQRNPYRPHVPLIRGRLYELTEQAPDSPLHPLEAAEEAYRKALSLDPYFLRARFRLGRLLLGNNRIEEGMAVLERNVEHGYEANELSINYFRLLSRMHTLLENPDDTARYSKRAEALRERLRRQDPDDTPASELAQPL